MNALNAPQFTNPDKAREYLEALTWPNGPVCPHCGVIGEHYSLTAKAGSKSPGRVGLWKCKDCRKQFSVTVGTVFERSKIALNVWLQAVYLLCSSKKGMSAHQLHRTLGVTYKTAWFMAHRIREAMNPDTGMFSAGPIGGAGQIVEADETYWGNNPRSLAAQMSASQRPTDKKMKIVALVERKGIARTFHVQNVTSKTLKPLILKMVDKNTHLMTDESPIYKSIGPDFKSHQTVNHSQREYARGRVTTNTVEGYFSILKRGLIGTYHHVSEAHLQRYIHEFDFRYSNRAALDVTDKARADIALKGIAGKRLTYRRTRGQAQAEQNFFG